LCSANRLLRWRHALVASNGRAEAAPHSLPSRWHSVRQDLY
jgi:hypothetical protein